MTKAKAYAVIGSTNPFAFPINLGVSDDASQVEREAQEMWIVLYQSQSAAGVYRQTTRTFHNAVEECNFDNWDGYGAKAIDELSWSKALLFSQLLPTNIPIPDIYVDSDGEATFEWYIAPRQVFSVTVRGNGELVYAGIFGSNKIDGTEHLDDELPQVILENIYRVFSGGAYLEAAQYA